MRTIIIDDKEKARKILVNFIDTLCKDVEIVAQAENVKTGVDAILKNSPDLVFLDINMPDGTGFDLLNKLGQINFKLIFVTAYEEYAIKAFKFSAIDYLLKPINPQEMANAVEKARQLVKNENFELKYKAFLANFGDKPKNDKKIVLKTAESIYLIDVKDIMRCEADGGYTTFFIVDGRKIMVSKNLKEYEEMLADCNFIRPHHSHLINITHMLSFEKRDGGSIVMKDKSMVPVSTRKKEELINSLGKQ
jgi:two-component system, LytTR family, response regulator